MAWWSRVGQASRGVRAGSGHLPRGCVVGVAVLTIADVELEVDPVAFAAGDDEGGDEDKGAGHHDGDADGQRAQVAHPDQTPQALSVGLSPITGPVARIQSAATGNGS